MRDLMAKTASLRARAIAATAALALLFFFAPAPAYAQQSESAPRPNIVLILADDLGYGDVRALNPASRIPTPNLDRLASEGMAMTDAHTGSAVCTPTRYGLLTGRYAWRTRLKRGVLNGYGEPLLAGDRATLGTFLGSQGYATGIVGKWHLGLGFEHSGDQATAETIDFARPVGDGPHTHGFDHSFIVPASLDFPPYVFIRNGQPTRFASIGQSAQKFPAFLREGPRGTDLVMENVLDDLLGEAVGFIQSRAKGDQPFFLYFPLTAPHKPVLPHPRFAGQTELGPYGDFIAQVDWTVGEVMGAIEDLGIAGETLVIFTSDNGSFMRRRDAPDAVDHVDDETIQAYRSDRHTANHVFRGTKADIWEAGHRVPFFVRWPGRIQAARSDTTTICLTDVFATIADILNADAPSGAAPDSFSFLPLLKGEAEPSAREPVIHHSAQGMFAIRSGSHKLVLGNGSGGREAPRGKPFGEPFQLFDLSADIGERTNLMDEKPEIAKRVRAEFDRIVSADR